MNAAAQRGFSLLELIASLAIVSLVSAALFQSTAAWMRLSARAASAAEASLSSIAGQDMFGRVVAGLVYAWPDEAELVFEGAPDGFASISTTPLDSLHPVLVPVSIIAVAPNAENSGRIIYQSRDVRWTLAEFDGAASISYLGADARWRPSWPPEQTPEPGPFNDGAYFDTPQIPAAIRIDFSVGAERRTWIAETARDPHIPQRIQDFF